MKKAFLTFTGIAVLLLISACSMGNDDPDTGDNTMPTLTIRNESSVKLYDAKWGNIILGDFEPGDTRSTEVDAGSGYVFFFKGTKQTLNGAVVYDGLNCRSNEVILVETGVIQFIFTDNTLVVETGNEANRNSLSKIDFLSQIAIESNGRTVAKDDVLAIGESLVNTPKEVGFVLKNTGVGKLLLSGNEPVKISGEDSTDSFSVIQPAASEIAPAASLDFSVRFTPREEKNYTVQVAIASNDPSGDFTFTLSAAGVQPKPIVIIEHGGYEISQNGTVDMGEVLIGRTGATQIFVKNTGAAPLVLDIDGIVITGTHAMAFTKTSNPGANISVGSTSQFTIQCSPTQAGENNAILTIPTNDSSRNPVVLYLRVLGLQGEAVFELSQDGAVIENNSIAPVDFGQVEVGGNKTLTFSIKNTGAILMQLIGNPLVDSSKTTFDVSTQPTQSEIASGGTALFIIRYTPVTEGEESADITIANNSASPQFRFTVKGTGYVKKPQITLKQNATVIQNHGAYNFGAIAVGKTKRITFTIGNTGEANLSFIQENNNRVNLRDNETGNYSIAAQPPASAVVTPNQTVEFTVEFAPKNIGNTLTATVVIKTNSRNDDEFTFTVTGNAGAASTEARLSGLQFTSGKLDQQFNANITEYTLKVDAGLVFVNATPISMASDIDGLTVNGTAQNSGARSQDIILASTSVVTIVVIAEDKTTIRTYNISINRILNYSSAGISHFWVSNMDESDIEDMVESIDEIANGDTRWMALPDETQVKFKIDLVNSNATVKLDNTVITQGVFTNGYTLTPGDSTWFDFTVLSEDGENQQAFTLESFYRGVEWERVGGNSPLGGLKWEPQEFTVATHNDQFILTLDDEVYVSQTGATWTKSFAFAEDAYIDHFRLSTVVFNNTIYNIGGAKKNSSGIWDIAPIVSFSTNGTIYTLAPSVTGLTNGVMNHASVVFGGYIYTMGGETNAVYETNAVWRSSNGTAWTQMTAPAWGARQGHAATVFNGKIYLTGGSYNSGQSEYRDVWSSANGTFWTQETASSAWTGRNDHTLNANSKGMWLVGGNDGYFKNDVWFSRDGKTWTQVLANAPFGERACHAAIVRDGYLYIFGGAYNSWDEPEYRRDIWRTYIGD